MTKYNIFIDSYRAKYTMFYFKNMLSSFKDGGLIVIIICGRGFNVGYTVNAN